MWVWGSTEKLYVQTRYHTYTTYPRQFTKYICVLNRLKLSTSYAWMPAREDRWMCILSIQVSMKPKQMKNMTLGESDIRQIAHDWGEFGVFESELSDPKCIYMTFFGGVDSQLQNSTVLNLLLFRVKMETQLMVNLFSLMVNSFLWRWKYRGQQVLKIQHVWKLFTKVSVNTYHCVLSVDNV